MAILMTLLVGLLSLVVLLFIILTSLGNKLLEKTNVRNIVDNIRYFSYVVFAFILCMLLSFGFIVPAAEFVGKLMDKI